jgi:hypothetical protein
MENMEITREYIIQTLKELDAKSEKTVGGSALAQKGINPYQIRTLIPEGLTKLKQDLGLTISRQERPLLDDELLEQMDKVVSKLKHIPTFEEIRRETGTTDKVFRSRFGKKGKREVFSHYCKWLEKHKSESENIKLVKEYLEDQGKTITLRLQLSKRKSSSSKKPLQTWPKGTGRLYGASLLFGNLIYEPTNEQGVVFLFGMVSKHLGFSIEWIGTEFPDCVAKRYIDGPRKRQQSVKIEFEYMSRQYKMDHPQKGCDIIVCWKDNWNDCPLEVIELSTEIKKLKGLPEFSNK